ncbi:hypothetical protein NEOKW01_1858 [Nematocida sp. AWRm80]|nr:hypothetical protein NEOKW01_1858 [Nematocida sp. AWRm80]
MHFIKEVSRAMESEYPLERADQSWDNVGILLEFDNEAPRTILLSNDLTHYVVDEAISKGINTIVVYHPAIFTPVKRITSDTPILFKAMNNRISIYSPHTALDGGKNGINYGIGSLIKGIEHDTTIGYIQKYKNTTLTIAQILNTLSIELDLNIIRYSLGYRHTLESIPTEIYIGAGASIRGMRKLVTESTLEHLEGKNTQTQDQISDAKEITDTKETDTGNPLSLFITGEASHHDMLYINRCNGSVIPLEHSRSERWFLKRLKEHLETALENVSVVLSETDKDPVDFFVRPAC